jgi:hypothetical protein
VTDIQSTIKLFAPYSNRGLTNVKYIFSRVFRSNINLNFLKILILLLAFPVIMSMCFSKLPLSKIDKPDHPPLYMDSNDISTVSEHKHLGLDISDNGSLEKHIDMITGKANKRINILRKFKFILDRKTLVVKLNKFMFFSSIFKFFQACVHVKVIK